MADYRQYLANDRQFEDDHKGNAEEILPTLHACIDCQTPLPRWLKIALSDALTKGWCGEIKSWDAVFGKPPTKLHYERYAADNKLSEEVFKMVIKEKAAGRAVDDLLFEEIGAEIGAGKTKVKELYALARIGKSTPQK
jgi:hypothetical protein